MGTARERVALSGACPACRARVSGPGFLSLMADSLERVSYLVITSYSIHYTKLYEGRELVVVMDDRVRAFIEERQRTGSAVGEFDLRHKDGRTVPCEVSSSIYQDALGNPRACVIFRDIADRKAAERRVRELSEFNERIISESPLGILVFRSDGRCVLASYNFV